MVSKKSKKLIKSNIWASSIILAIFGIIFISFGSFLKYRASILSFNQNPPIYEIKNERVSKPVFINIEKVNVKLEVESTRIINGIWQVSDSKANFLETSARPGENGNIVIYGHNKRSVFGNLIGKDLKGEVIEIINEKGESHLYKIKMILTVDPSEIIVVSPSDYEVLTLYTCTGLFDLKRLVLKAFPVETNTLE